MQKITLGFILIFILFVCSLKIKTCVLAAAAAVSNDIGCLVTVVMVMSRYTYLCDPILDGQIRTLCVCVENDTWIYFNTYERSLHI